MEFHRTLLATLQAAKKQLPQQSEYFMEAITLITAKGRQVAHLICSIGKWLRTGGKGLKLHLQVYGPLSGSMIWAFSSRRVWHMQKQFLSSVDDDYAIRFKNSVQSECKIMAITVRCLRYDNAIITLADLLSNKGVLVAQLSITSYTLPHVSQAIGAQALWIFSLYSAVIIVYSTWKQYQAIGELVRPDQIRRWIREKSESDGIALEARLPGAASVIALSVNRFLLYTSIVSFMCGFGAYLSSVQPQLAKVYQFCNAACWFFALISGTVSNNLPSDSSTDILHRILETRRAHNEQRMAEEGRETACSLFSAGQNNIQDDDIEAAAAAENETPLAYLKDYPKPSASGEASMKASRSQSNVAEVTEVLTVVTSNPSTSVTQEPRAIDDSQGTAKSRPINTDHQLFIQALRDSAKLRQESAKMDELLARYFKESLG